MRLVYTTSINEFSKSKSITADTTVIERTCRTALKDQLDHSTQLEFEPWSCS